MSLEAVAKAYTDCVNLEERARRESPELAEETAVLRADLHALLMDALRQAHIPFADRSDAARIAFDIIQGESKTA
jgi:hypothetical protein